MSIEMNLLETSLDIKKLIENMVIFKGQNKKQDEQNRVKLAYLVSKAEQNLRGIKRYYLDG